MAGKSVSLMSAGAAELHEEVGVNLRMTRGRRSICELCISILPFQSKLITETLIFALAVYFKAENLNSKDGTHFGQFNV